MNDNFKINAYFCEDGDEIEKILANFLIRMLKGNIMHEEFKLFFQHERRKNA